MNEHEAREAERYVRGLFPRASDEHAEEKFLEVGAVMRTLRERCPDIAREQARLAREAVRQRETAAGRTQEYRQTTKQEAERAERERAEQLAVLRSLPADELAALKAAALARLTPNLRHRYEQADPMTFDPLARLMAAEKWSRKAEVAA